MLLGFATHANVAATVLIGLDDSAAELAAAAEQRADRIEFVTLAGCGGSAGTVRAAEPLVERLSLMPPRRAATRAGRGDHLALECGGSDALSGITANPALGIASDLLVAAGGTSILAETSELIGAEHLLARRAVTPEVGDALFAMIDRFERVAARWRRPPRGQPVPGNIAGGLTTLEEKSLGAAKKGGNAPIQSVLEYAEAPRSPACTSWTRRAMTSSRWSAWSPPAATSSPSRPAAAPRRARRSRPASRSPPTRPCIRASTDDLDVNAGTALDEGEPLSEIGERIYETILATAAGRLTAAERHGNREFSISREQP